MYVLVSQDCRDEPTATNQVAKYEGRFDTLTGRRYRGPRADLRSNPRLLLQDGTYIWGLECFWIPVRDAMNVYRRMGKIEEANRLWALRCAFTKGSCEPTA